MIIIIICESAKNEVVEDEEKKTSSSKLIVAIFQHFFQFKSDIRIYFWLWFSGKIMPCKKKQTSFALCKSPLIINNIIWMIFNRADRIIAIQQIKHDLFRNGRF